MNLADSDPTAMVNPPASTALCNALLVKETSDASKLHDNVVDDEGAKEILWNFLNLLTEGATVQYSSETYYCFNG